MPTPLDNLSVGRWIAVTSSWEEVHGFMGSAVQYDALVTGIPLKILSISLPFISVSNGAYRFALDTRKMDFTLLSKQYVNSLSNARLHPNGDFSVPETGDLFAPRRITTDAEVPSPQSCPVCGERMVEELLKPGQGLWGLLCKQCGFRGQLPQQGQGA